MPFLAGIFFKFANRKDPDTIRTLFNESISELSDWFYISNGIDLMWEETNLR